MSICKTCNGLGKIKLMPFGYICTCAECKGTGETRDYITNEEWFCSLPTEEKALWIERIMFIVRYRKEVEDGAYMQTITKKDYIENWLKEKHNEQAQ